MADQPDGSEWLKSLGILVSGGGIWAVAQEGVKWFSRRGTDQQSAIERHENRLREDYANALKRIDILEKELEEERRINQAQFRANVALETENTLLRGRYHRIRSYMMYWVHEVQRLTGITEERLPSLPEWIDEPIAGPTSAKPNIPMSSPEDGPPHA